MKDKNDIQINRLRRLRKTPALRAMLQEHHLRTEDLILPIFVEENLDERTPISSLPDIFRETENSLKAAAKAAQDAGLGAIILFGISHNKDEGGSDATKAKGLLARMIKTAKVAAPDIAVIADVCFCEYTTHGHCGVLTNDGDVNNDATLKNLAKQAVIAANAGADIIAPSGMMDGMVATIRSALDKSGHTDVPILSYAAKFASSYYGPFRDAAGCSLGDNKSARKDRKTYQMNPANANEALREVEQDIAEGADMIMIKPGLPYLDIIKSVKDTFGMPTFAYNVSGEYAMLKAAAAQGMLDYEDTLMETLLSFKRAGCDGIITYGAMDAARILKP